MKQDQFANLGLIARMGYSASRSCFLKVGAQLGELGPLQCPKLPYFLHIYRHAFDLSRDQVLR